MFEHTFKVVIIGDNFPSRHELTNMYLSRIFYEDMQNTIGVDFFQKIIDFNEKDKIKLHFWDINLTSKTRSLFHIYFKGANGLMMLYDITLKAGQGAGMHKFTGNEYILRPYISGGVTHPPLERIYCQARFLR